MPPLPPALHGPRAKIEGSNFLPTQDMSCTYGAEVPLVQPLLPQEEVSRVSYLTPTPTEERTTFQNTDNKVSL